MALLALLRSVKPMFATQLSLSKTKTETNKPKNHNDSRKKIANRGNKLGKADEINVRDSLRGSTGNGCLKSKR